VRRHGTGVFVLHLSSQLFRSLQCPKNITLFVFGFLGSAPRLNGSSKRDSTRETVFFSVEVKYRVDCFHSASRRGTGDIQELYLRNFTKQQNRSSFVCLSISSTHRPTLFFSSSPPTTAPNNEKKAGNRATHDTQEKRISLFLIRLSRVRCYLIFLSLHRLAERRRLTKYSVRT
jgi:hypothetical protein